jgi:DNA-directed RNA polymerase II subunit RPB2
MGGDVSEDEIWHLIQSYHRRHGLCRHQIESFDHFLHVLLPHIVQESAEICATEENGTKHVVTLCNVSVERPSVTDADGTERPLYPHMARLRNHTYSSAVLVDVVHDILVGETRTERRLFRETCLCRLPVMVGCSACHTQHTENSLECRLDNGGYFIVGGNEKVLVAQEKLHQNVPYVFSMKPPSRFSFVCELRSCHERKLRSTSSLYVYMTNAKCGAIPRMVVQLPFVTTYVPVMALLRLLGVATRQEAMEAILGTEELRESQLLCSILDNDHTADMSVDDLYDYVGREGTRETSQERRRRYLEHIINCEVIPHQGLVGTPDVLRGKVLLLGIMIRKLMHVYTGKLQCDDRDHMSTKRVDCAGTQYGLLFRQVLRMVHKSLAVQVQRATDQGRMHFTNVGNLITSKKLTQQFRYALATGNWGILTTRGNSSQNGVAQQLGRMTSAATQSLLRKIATPVARETKNPKPRQLHPTCWGLICPMDTPEGGACGLSKSLAIMAHVRVGTFSDAVYEQLDVLRTTTLSDLLRLSLEASAAERSHSIPVLVNGTLHMYTTDADRVVAELRTLRRDGRLCFDTTVALVDGHLIVETDPGCLLRPLLLVEALPRLSALIRDAPRHDMLMDHLLQHHAVEYIDKQEEHMLRVALGPYKEPEDGWGAYTHCEIDPSLIVGLCGALIPFPEFNQSPRNTYQSAMMKQALGVPTLNFSVRMDTVMHVMVAPQRPLVTTRMDEVVGASDAPSGVNAIVAIMCYTGQNQEDSLIVNQAALDRGLFTSIKFQTYRDEERQNGGSDAERIKPIGRHTHIVGRRDANYDSVDELGTAAVGTRVQPNDVLIAKTVTTTDVGEGSRRTVERDSSTVVKNESGIVDAVLHVTNQDGTHMTKVRVRKTRRPIVGDKLSSRCGQKGVIGAILPQEDMPFTEDGMVPDIIVNPHAIPSRMTIGQLAECLLAILCTHAGERGDATMFRGTSLEYLCEQLGAHGCDPHGRTRMRNGFTGESFETMVFLGPTYYQRLRHMAADKDHARSRGPVHWLSRQPTEGRARNGGLRFGEMERDCLISHGATQMIMDRLLENSDPAHLTVCGRCGLLAHPAAQRTHVRHKEAMCHNCASSSEVRTMQAPYSFRLLLQELQAMSFGVRFDF